MNDFHKPDDVDRRIADALRARAGQVDEHSLRSALSPRANSMPPRRHIRWTAPLLAAAAVVAVVAGTVAVTSSNSSSSPRRIPVGSQLPGSTSALPTDTAASDLPLRTPSSLPATPSATTTESPTATNFPDVGCPFPDVPCKTPMQSYYLPIWPFQDYAQASQWQRTASASGSSPWHGDAVATVESYVQNVLGFTDLDVATIVSPAASTEAYVQIGYRLPNKTVAVAAVVHLVRYGSALGDVLAPWEIVGTEDPPDGLALHTPRFGSHQTSPLLVAGVFTGVDGNLVVSVRDQDGVVLGQAAGLPAGGEARPWSERVDYKAASSPGAQEVRVVVVFAGGAIVQHSQFAIQAFYG